MNFEWTDELVREFFLEYRQGDGPYPISVRMKEFKEEKIREKTEKIYTKDELISYCRDAVSSVWGANSLSSAQSYFDNFLAIRGLRPSPEIKIKINN